MIAIELISPTRARYLLTNSNKAKRRFDIHFRAKHDGAVWGFLRIAGILLASSAAAGSSAGYTIVVLKYRVARLKSEIARFSPTRALSGFLLGAN